MGGPKSAPARYDTEAGNIDPPRAGASGEISPQLTAFFTSAPILASSAAVNSFSAKATGQTVPSSRFALSLKPNVAYLALNFCALWKKQTTLPSLAYAGIPYQVLGARAGALALMMAWSRSAMARSGFGISAIFTSTSLSPSAFFARGPRRTSAFSSWARSFIAARSSSVNPLTALPVTVALLADFCVSVLGLMEPPHTDSFRRMLGSAVKDHHNSGFVAPAALPSAAARQNRGVPALPSAGPAAPQPYSRAPPHARSGQLREPPREQHEPGRS